MEELKVVMMRRIFIVGHWLVVVVDVEVAECENNFEILAHKEHKKRESLSSLSLEVSVGNIGTEEDT